MAIDSAKIGTVAAQLMEELEAAYGEDASIATVALVAAVDHGGGADYHPHYHFKFSPGTPKHVGLGLLMVVQDTIASQ
jgi:hypothetical protein